MMTPLLFTGLATLFFILWLVLCTIEEKRGQRLFLAGVRDWFDHRLANIVTGMEKVLRYIVKYIITLSWYYGLHHMLKLVLQFIAGLYQVIESVLIKNRERTRALRKERKLLKKSPNTHLSEIAEHKAGMKLSPSEMRKRKDRALKGH